MEKPTSLGDVLSGALKQANLQINLEMGRLWNRWDDIVGPTVAQNAKPAAIKGNLLIVYVSSTPWMQQLQFLKEDIMDKLNSDLGRPVVEDIRFKIGPVD
jgi:predicted nucleic acid-binding Zn ribbon protein